MATTTNYGWTTPDDTALVKDGASAIRTLGSSVDTTTKNLNPSTTLGDLEYRSATANTNTRLGIGTTGQVLTVSGGVPAWSAAPAANPTVSNNTIATGQTTTSTSYTDLATAGPTVSMTTGTKALVFITAGVENNAGTRRAWMSFAVSGATSISASDTTSLMLYGASAAGIGATAVYYLDTLTAGSNTFTAKYKSQDGGGVDFGRRSITVMNLGS